MPVKPVKSEFLVKVRGLQVLCQAYVQRDDGGWVIEDHELLSESDRRSANWLQCRLTDDDYYEIDDQIVQQLSEKRT